ncbi:MAG: nucleotidyltransferase family protein [Pontibacterium sp.]
MVNIPDAERLLLSTIFTQYLPDKDIVLAFGSRVTGTYRPYSDLDLVIVSDKNQSLPQLFQLQDALEEPKRPYRVDLLN